MFRVASLTRPLAFAAVAATLAGAGSVTALAQTPGAQAQEPPQPSEATQRSLSLFDKRLTAPKSPVESWLSGFEMKCVGCRGFDAIATLPESTNATAPWVLQGKWRRSTPLGVVSTGFVGVRNYVLPLYTGMPLGGDFNPGALGSSSIAFAPVSQWSLTAGVEKTLFKSRSGATVGVSADVLIPVNTKSGSAGDPRISALTSRAMRVGIVVRW